MIRVVEMLYDSDGIKAVQNAVTMKAFMNEIKDWNYAINSDPYNLFYKVCREFWKAISDPTNPIKGSTGETLAKEYEYGDISDNEIANEFWNFFFVEFPDDEALSKVDEY